MKNYKKVEMVAKNAPSGSYAAGCPTYYAQQPGCTTRSNADGYNHPENCRQCEVAQ